MPVRELLERIPSYELSEWQAFYRVDPFGDQRADLRQGITSAIIANMFADKGKAQPPMVFMPFREPEPEPEPDPQPAKQQMTIVQQIHQAVTTIQARKHGHRA